MEGDENRWRLACGIILEAVHKSGSFLDVGCANGHLVESLTHWLGTSFNIAFYGLDISEELVDLAKRRLPDWNDRFFVAMHSTEPPRTDTTSSAPGWSMCHWAARRTSSTTC